MNEMMLAIYLLSLLCVIGGTFMYLDHKQNNG